MGMKVGELYAVADIKDKQFNTKLGRMRRMLGNKGALVGAAVAGTAAIGAAFAAAAADGIRQFSDMEKQMSEVFTLLPNASSDAKEQMIDNMQEFKMEMGTTTSETVPALYDAISAGVPEDNVFEFLETAQKAARGGVTDLNTAVDGLTTVINAYGKEVSDAEDVSDILFTTVKTGKTTMDELGSSLSDVAPIAAAVGVNFEDVGAALATMTAQGVPTAEATTQLRQAMNELSKEGTNAYDVFKSVAGEAFTEFIENGGNLQEAMVLMEQAAEDSNTQVQNLFQNIRGGQAALTLTGSGAETFAKNLDEMQDRAGATDEAFETMMDTSATWQERLGSAIEVIREKIGEELNPTFDKLVKYIVQNMPTVIEHIEGLGERVETVTENLGYAATASDIFFNTLKTYVITGVNGIKILASAFGIIKDSIDVVVSQVGYATIDMYLFFAKAMDKILSQARRLEKLPGIGDMFGDIADNSEEAIENMENDQDKLAIKVRKNTKDMEKGFGNLIENVKEFGSDAASGIMETTGAGQTLFDMLVNNDDAANDYSQTLSELRRKGVKAFSEINAESNNVEANVGGNASGNGGSGIGGGSSNTEKEIETRKSYWVAYTKWAKEQQNKELMASVNKRRKEEAAEQQKWNAYTKWAIEYNRKQRMEAFKTTQREKELEQEKWASYTEWARNYDERQAERKEEQLLASIEKVAKEKQLEKQKWASYTEWAKQQQAEQETINQQELEMYENKFGFIREGFSKAFTSILQGTKSVTDAFGNLWRGILDQVMAKLAEMAASKVFNFLISGGSGGILGGIGSFFGGIFHNGGIVPGPIGAERLILAQGGETVTPAGKNNGSGGGGYKSANIYLNIDGRQVAHATKQHLADTVRIHGGANY